MTDEQQRMVEDNYNLVGFALAKYYPQLAGDEDIHQIASVGLCKAAVGYDADKGAFSTYAIIKIRGEISGHLRKINRDYDLAGAMASIDYAYGDSQGRVLAETLPNIDYTNFKEELEASAFLESLNDEELSIMKDLYEGYTYKEIAKKMGKGLSTIHYRKEAIKRKYKASKEENAND